MLQVNRGGEERVLARDALRFCREQAQDLLKDFLSFELDKDSLPVVWPPYHS